MLDIRLLSGVKGSGHRIPVGSLGDSGRTQGAPISLSATTRGPVSLVYFSRAEGEKAHCSGSEKPFDFFLSKEEGATWGRKSLLPSCSSQTLGRTQQSPALAQS